MNTAAEKQDTQVRPKRRERRLSVRLETALAQRLEKAANDADISPSDKVRRILDAVLPQTP